MYWLFRNDKLFITSNIIFLISVYIKFLKTGFCLAHPKKIFKGVILVSNFCLTLLSF